MNCFAISLAPGFRRVFGGVKNHNRFSGFPSGWSRTASSRGPLKRLTISLPGNTRLKPGANEIGSKAKRVRIELRAGLRWVACSSRLLNF